MSPKTSPQPWEPLTYYDAERYKYVGEVEEAWAKDERITNYRLKDGNVVMLKHSTIGECIYSSAVVPAGVTGVVAHARTARVRRRGGKGSLYFANVNIVSPDGAIYRVRVPHSSLRICNDNGS